MMKRARDFGDEGPEHFVLRSDHRSRACSVLRPNWDILKVPVNHSEGPVRNCSYAGIALHATDMR